MAYTRINWQNEPSEATALNDVNLNKMDSAIYDHDQRLDTAEGDIEDIESDVATAQGDITDLENGKVDKVENYGLSLYKDFGYYQLPEGQRGTWIGYVGGTKQNGQFQRVGDVYNGVVVDSAMSDSSENPVQNKVVKSALDNKVDKESGKGLSEVKSLTVTKLTDVGTDVAQVYYLDQSDTPHATYIKNGITVDSSLSSSSTNPVQNKVVKSAIDEKSTVSISDTLATGTTLANITIDGTTTAIKGSDIEVDEELSPTSTNPVENKVIYDALNNLLPSKTVSGNPISISDASGFNAKALTVTMNPIQDLHGYPNPWAGGEGKNRLDIGSRVNQTTANIVYTSDDNYITMNGTKEGSGYANLSSLTISLEAGTYYAKAFVISGTSTYDPYIYLFDGTANLNTSNMLGEEREITIDTAKTCTIRVGIFADGQVFTNYKIGIVISKTSGITSWSPYSNICPISGRDSVTVTRTGVNQWDEEWRNGYYNTIGEFVTYANNVSNKNPIAVIPNTTYYLHIETLANGGFGRLCFYDKNGVFVSTQSIAGNKNYLLTIPSNAYYLNFDLQANYGSTYKNDISINYPSTATAYEPYTAETKTHQYSDTIYGGVDDFVNGGATSEWEVIDLGDLNYTYYAPGIYFFAPLSQAPVRPSSATVKTDAISSIYKAVPANQISYSTTGADGCFAISTANDNLVIRDTRFTSASDLKTALAGQKVCYPLATPTTISTSAEEITLLKGNNVLSTNADDMEMKYSVSLDSLLPTTTRTLAKSQIVEEPKEETDETEER